MSTDQSIRTNLWKYYEDIDMPGGYKHNLPQTLRMIDLLYNSQFKSGKYDNQGLRKFFSNIVKPTCDIATKFIDLDTKDFILNPEKENDEFRVWIMQKRFKQWLKDSDFGVLLNELAFDLPKYGTIVVKNVKDEEKGYKWKKVNIQNIRVDAGAKCLDESDFVYELVTMSRGEIEDMISNSKGYNADEAQALLDSSDEQSFVVYDCYHKKGKKWKHYLKSDLFASRQGDILTRTPESQINVEAQYIPAITLLSNTVDELPYKEHNWETVPGRWLGFGFVEYLEDNQVAINEAENLERKGLAFKALQLWQTRDESIGGQNVLVNSQNGDILHVASELTPVQKDNSDISAFNNTRANWNQNTERKTFTTDITTGASLPSRTPLGVANLQANFASSYFEIKRENYGMFLKEIVIEKTIPQFEKDTKKQHDMVFNGSDSEMEKFDQSVADILVADASMKYGDKTGFMPSEAQKMDAKNRLVAGMKKKQNRYLKVPRGYYENAQYMVDVLLTGESVDNGTRSQVIQLVLQIVGTNPAVFQNPVAKSLIFQLLSLGGINPVDVSALSQQASQPQAPQQVAGSLASPGQAVQGMAQTSKQI